MDLVAKIASANRCNVVSYDLRLGVALHSLSLSLSVFDSLVVTAI